MMMMAGSPLFVLFVSLSPPPSPFYLEPVEAGSSGRICVASCSPREEGRLCECVCVCACVCVCDWLSQEEVVESKQ
ncbi:hypothetical protein DFJ73DRAFT_857552 [Zopfochytrium polystomum]|nr:hypothetical protein DFJ73DRAFT_857552 [Zopfochytrium polystomum]